MCVRYGEDNESARVCVNVCVQVGGREIESDSDSDSGGESESGRESESGSESD